MPFLKILYFRKGIPVNETLLDRIDLKESKQLKVRLNGHDAIVVHLRIADGKYFAMVAGGELIEVSKEEFDLLDEKLAEHLRKHVL